MSTGEALLTKLVRGGESIMGLWIARNVLTHNVLAHAINDQEQSYDDNREEIL